MGTFWMSLIVALCQVILATWGESDSGNVRRSSNGDYSPPAYPPPAYSPPQYPPPPYSSPPKYPPPSYGPPTPGYSSAPRYPMSNGYPPNPCSLPGSANLPGCRRFRPVFLPVAPTTITMLEIFAPATPPKLPAGVGGGPAGAGGGAVPPYPPAEPYRHY